MIKNVTFDFGQVLVKFSPAAMVRKRVFDETDAALLEKVVFDRLYWDQLDAGAIENEEVVAACKTRLPERLWQVAEEIFYGWAFGLPPVEGMAELVAYVKNTLQKRVFLLSNISTYFVKNAAEYPVLDLFEDRVYSAVCGFVKPSAEIFQFLCDKNGILPSETLFIDDSPINIAGAEAFGIKGYLFDGDAEKLKKYLDEVCSEK
ncbi:MAG: HAD family phosphatase [Clostridia bacterium]|nr:HAD family phosphatase [Clostridia bacterium]